jgi:hypothetical protein
MVSHLDFGSVGRLWTLYGGLCEKDKVPENKGKMDKIA